LAREVLACRAMRWSSTGRGTTLVFCVTFVTAWTMRAHAFCRTRDNPNATDGMVTSQCYDTTDKPVFWRNTCIGFSLNQAASSQVPYATAKQVLEGAFANWSMASCPMGGHPSITVEDLGPSVCAQHEANSDAANQNLIVFHDNGWPYSDCQHSGGETLALTTVTYHLDTGELWDVDIEVNTSCGHRISTTEPVPASAWDLASIFQHETGHFLGLAHSPDPRATMYWTYAQGSDTKRALDSDDIAGICSVYLPSGTRSVDPSVSSGGVLAGGPCDPTPRNGFTTECTPPPTPAAQGCTCRAAGSRGGPAQRSSLASGLLLLGALGGRRTTRRRGLSYPRGRRPRNAC
jgi:hypothetical protein